MVDGNITFGFELLQSIYGNQLLKKEDVLILFVHWYFVKSGFKCIGLGDSKAFDPAEQGSELLPEGWNTRPNYALRYVNNNKLYILHGTKSDEDLLLNLLRVDNQNVSNVQFAINQTVENLQGPLQSLIPTHQNVLNTIRVELVNSILPGSSADVSAQTVAPRERTVPTDVDVDPLRVGPSRRSPVTGPWSPDVNLPNVGDADLDPLGRGGGMLFDPPIPGDGRGPFNPLRPGLGIPGRLPPGAVPPYARFDPFGPPDIIQPRPRRDPDNDDLPPPGFNMFM